MRPTIAPGFLLVTLFALGPACSGGVDLTGDAGPDGADDSTAEAVDGTDAPDAPEEADETAGDAVDVPADDGSPDADGDIADDGGGDCAPMDAHAEGDCEMVLPGVAWNGTHCVPLGSGCSCAGADCDAVYDDVAACVAARLSCYGEVCGPQEAAGRVCDGGGCAIVFGPFWDGRECFTTAGCECAGADCDAAWASLDECVAAHAGCDGALCLADGGQWFPASAGFCGFSCGVPNPTICFTPYDSCDCGPGATFLPGSGCLVGAETCDPAMLCGASGGTWHPMTDCFCGFTCGSPGACGACLDSCDCGPHANFQEGRGCVPDPACPDTDRPAICSSTGGTWHDCSAGDPGCSCGDYACGVPNRVEPCIAPGCDCGPLRNFDASRGCVYDHSCVLREPGQDCSGGAEFSTCREGLVCCSSCGAYACQTCRAPCCPDDPGCMTDGCPPPPP
ncbi:MAG: hypothetical protein HY907_05240 [Deltaproteobacteria bacterium]|nr:hypothetical protein [Deltaproteobacteria bacterium]